MIKVTALLASVGFALSLTACAGTDNRGVESVHQPVVDRSDYALDVAVSNGRLVGGERERLAGWFETMKLGYGDRISIDDPDGDGSTARAEIGGVVAGYGLMLSDQAPVVAAPVSPGVVRVVVSRMRASVPGCPDWSRNPSRDFNANTSSNFGCATNSNLAAMIANPADLVRGRSAATAADPAVSAKAIDSYRKLPATGAAGLPGGVTSVSVKGN